MTLTRRIERLEAGAPSDELRAELLAMLAEAGQEVPEHMLRHVLEDGHALILGDRLLTVWADTIVVKAYPGVELDRV